MPFQSHDIFVVKTFGAAGFLKEGSQVTKNNFSNFCRLSCGGKGQKCGQKNLIDLYLFYLFYSAVVGLSPWNELMSIGFCYLLNNQLWFLSFFSGNYHSRSGSLIFKRPARAWVNFYCISKSSSYKLSWMLVYFHCYPRSYFSKFSVNITSKMSKSYSFSTFLYHNPFFNTVQALIDPEAVDWFVEFNVVVPPWNQLA